MLPLGLKYKAVLCPILQAPVTAKGKISAQTIDPCSRSKRQVAGDQYRALHLSLLSMFSSLTLYDILEETLLASTKAYYISSSQQAVSSMSTSNYVDFARRRIDYEQSYALWMYRDEIGCKKNLDVVLFELIKSHIPSLVEGKADVNEMECTFHVRIFRDLNFTGRQ